ncbi:Scarecrow-like protein [Tripterygium wilfordii]|uniref:Scarecrow-like protein n=1 Tax=Tripterygium wilfordii TaxID=458696 RepID=A0A7J7CED0_TRIWF|nr:scarecrow-like protein 18 [Tripterygium wilfordii]XP_038686568.1 scarecrow-like protein 18 [Tripterygium wilfordii]KAF5732462.1 Scarecrow-like protein [Tripterygium wilfordii]
MLGSLNTSGTGGASSRQQQDQEEEEPSPADLHNIIAAPAATHMRQMLISCAELVSQSDFGAAHRLRTYLTANSSPLGDSTERLVHQFSKALSLRLNPTFVAAAPPQYHINVVTNNNSISNNCYSTCTVVEQESCYLSLNQITPFIRFSHLTANQAILEALQVGQQAIHILDLDIMHGLQWPPFMQALSDRSQCSQPPPMLRITGGGHDLTTLHRTGERLLKFAQSLGLTFQFQPLVLLNVNDLDLILSSLSLLPDETLAVNCVLYLHRLLLKDRDSGSSKVEDLRLFLRKIKALNPRVVTVAERELGNHNEAVFLRRFVESLDHYSAIFESLEATLPPNSRERMAVEQIWFGREIAEMVAGEGERHQRLEWWETMLRSSGFVNVPLSPFALSQAKLLLRLHYPCEGYQLHTHNNSFFLAWQNRPLFSVSSWR